MFSLLLAVPSAPAARRTSIARGSGKRKNERGSPPGRSLERDRPAVRLHDPLADAEPQAIAARALRAGPIHAVERLEHPLGLVLGNPHAVIADTHHDRVGPL